MEIALFENVWFRESRAEPFNIPSNGIVSCDVNRVKCPMDKESRSRSSILAEVLSLSVTRIRGIHPRKICASAVRQKTLVFPLQIQNVNVRETWHRYKLLGRHSPFGDAFQGDATHKQFQNNSRWRTALSLCVYYGERGDITSLLRARGVLY